VRLLRMRFTVRRMMAAVAALALVLGGAVESIRVKRQRDEYLKIAGEHGIDEALYRGLERDAIDSAQLSETLLESMSVLNEIRSRPRVLGSAGQQIREMSLPGTELGAQEKEDAANERAGAALHHKSAMYHAALKRKYLAAAARPWRRIEPDPPRPDPSTRAL
jgi:hypothetical protein